MRFVDTVIEVFSISALVIALLLNAVQAVREHRTAVARARLRRLERGEE